MYTNMEQWAEIRRRVLVEGTSKRSILREYGIHWDTLTKILTHSGPPGYRLSKPRMKRKLEPYLPIIKQILQADQQAPPKQRHTAQRIFERLRDEYGYTGGITIVKDAVRAWRRQHQEVYVPLRHAMGQAQVDFGQAQVQWQGETMKVALFVMTLPYSDAIFCCVYPRECTEAFLEGHRRAFEFFQGVPRRISYDNSRIAMKKILGPRERELTDAFIRLKSHYLFASHFCRVRRPNEKGHVENLLGYARRNFLVPVPTVDSLEALNHQLEQACRRDLERTLRGKSGSKAQRLAEEGDQFLSLISETFATGRTETVQANSLSLIRFDRNDYSVPVRYAYQELTAVGEIEQVRILCKGEVIARHPRCWTNHQVIFDPVHYLALLERKPGAFDVARPLEDWDLPVCFGILRRRLENELAERGTREFIKVLRLLEHASLAQLKAAVEYGLSIGAIHPDAIRLILEHRRDKPVLLFCLDGRPHLKAVHVQQPDLQSYHSLLGGGEG